jgi:hypothetical protein
MLLGQPSCWCRPARMSSTNLLPSCTSSSTPGSSSSSSSYTLYQQLDSPQHVAGLSAGAAGSIIPCAVEPTLLADHHNRDPQIQLVRGKRTQPCRITILQDAVIACPFNQMQECARKAALPDGASKRARSCSEGMPRSTPELQANTQAGTQMTRG